MAYIKAIWEWCKYALLKLVSVIFYQIFISHWMIALQKLWKCFLFHLKSSFRSQDIFLFPSSPLFSCFRGWSKINLKVYDVINCLDKNLTTHFVWYPKKEKRYDIETLSIDRILIRNVFMEKSGRKIAPKVSPRPLFNFRKTAIACKKFFQK